MIKKFIPVITILGVSALIVGATHEPIKEKKENYVQNINSFSNEFSKYTNANNTAFATTALNKYTVSLEDNLDEISNPISNENIENSSLGDLSNNANPETTFEINDENNNNINSENDTNSVNAIEDNEEIDFEEDNESEVLDDNTIDFNEENEQISTLYSLSSDLETSCDYFCELKENITEAIIETQNLIDKVQKKEIELTSEQKLFITEQAQQLKNLGRQLSTITTELSFNLSDLSSLITTNNQDLDSLSLKYLVVLDNLVNGNEMLQSGLNSLNLINQMFNMRTNTLPSNNQGRILYGFRQNNNPPIIKDYYIDENGELVENNQETIKNENTETKNNEETVSEDEKVNIDTYKNSQLKTNIDTYQNNNFERNIDSFFNTALLDNEFMYGNGAYAGGNGMYGYANPYSNSYANYEANNTRNGVNNNYKTQDIENENKTNKTTKEKRHFKLKKNIDTFKDENEPDIKTKLGNIKNSIAGFFGKFKKSDLDNKIDNPIYRFNETRNDR